VEVGESIFAAATRECVEESGLEVMPTGILDVEHNVWGLMGDWMRFTMVGVLTGKGELKTKEGSGEL
jgi:8-oxo-dGTP pyrophosphatase MutT (NUDIX family)